MQHNSTLGEGGDAAVWWQRPGLQAAAAALIAASSGLALAVGICLLAVAIAHGGKGQPPPLLLSAVWSVAAATSFSCSLAYLLLEPRRPPLLRVSAILAASMACALALLLLRNG